ncbi:hypothetical protein ACIP10_36675, partial [Streptomyces galbus]|uniref:hypothetical protein n=1 Tax=Streptomyces galbus TaxID=33898 RepID=UPI003828CBDE
MLVTVRGAVYSGVAVPVAVSVSSGVLGVLPVVVSVGSAAPMVVGGGVFVPDGGPGVPVVASVPVLITEVRSVVWLVVPVRMVLGSMVVMASGSSGVVEVVDGVWVVGWGVGVGRVVGRGVRVCRGVGVSGWVLPVPAPLSRPLLVWVVVGVGQVVGLVGVLRWGYFHWAKWRPSSVRALPARLVTMPEVADPSMDPVR